MGNSYTLLEESEIVEWTHLDQSTDERRVLVNAIINLRFA
jgi:hypothetical protein